MTDRPAPLCAPDTDLRGFGFMPLDVIRLVDSDLYAISSGDEFKAAVTLWCKAWSQIPAGSLPNDERILAHLSGAGSAGWIVVRDVALHGWIECSDGRLYHPVVASKAAEAFKFRAQQREKSRKRWDNDERANRKRAGENREQTEFPLDPDHPAGQAAVMPRDNHRQSLKTGTGTGTETKKEEPRAPVVALPPLPADPSSKAPPSAPPTTDARASRIPPDWKPSPADAEFARSHGLNPDTTADEFRNHWLGESGQKARKLDWGATWRANCIRVADMRRERREQPQRETASAARRRKLGIRSILDFEEADRATPIGETPNAAIKR